MCKHLTFMKNTLFLRTGQFHYFTVNTRDIAINVIIDIYWNCILEDRIKRTSTKQALKTNINH